ncbi:MAG TPA: hydroxyethylthiazole kinase [Sutterella sp.]|nr:hydroxyethylthiazole kinase [Sutterella sp.]
MTPFTSLPAANPLVHCMTNRVADAISADVLLASGASPAMIYDIDEVESFVTIASALLINVGTITREEKPAFLLAAQTAHRLHKPWVLDPVAAGVLPSRDAFLSELTALKPTLIRANAGEILAMAGFQSQMKGVDSVSTVEDAVEAARALALKTETFVAVTGKSDYVTDGHRLLKIQGGAALSSLVTGLGCSLSALCAAFLAIDPDPFEAAESALTLSKKAQEIAHTAFATPQAYRTAYIDALYTLTHV